MCGIAGIITKDTSELTIDRLKKMTDIIEHRGPDGDGQWISADGQVGLGHRRLSIIDLSHEADQPMHYLGRYSIVFNGEIYNYIELKETLVKQGYTFKTQSDTEVLMALYDRDKENCLQLLDGMFSFVIYDAQENNVFCARDRFGEKPFFYSYEKGKYFLFGSEMKCLWAGGIAKEVNNKMLFNYLSYGFTENPNDRTETHFKNCIRLPHSHFLKINLNSLEISIQPYYDINWKNINYSISIEEAKTQFRELFTTSVKRRLRSDVTIGSSLSGGLDSSLVVKIIDEFKLGTIQKQNTFSAVFPGYKKDERQFMDFVINSTNVEPFFVTPNDDGLINDIDKVIYHQEEPFTSASIYAQFCVMKLAKQNNVTVLLDGQGADEIMAGYHRYFIDYFNELKNTNPSLYKTELDEYNKMYSTSDINPSVNTGWKNKLKQVFPNSASQLRKHQEKLKQIKDPLFNKDFFNAYYKESFENKYVHVGLNNSLYSSTMNKGLQELLRYADRNSMANSREVRLPFLSHELVDFLFTLPSSMKINNGWTKWIMRETFQDILPKEIAWRKDKIGYEPPQKSWMERKEISDKIQFQKEKLIDNKILNENILSKKILAEDAGEVKNNSWRILMGGSLIEKF